MTAMLFTSSKKQYGQAQPDLARPNHVVCFAFCFHLVYVPPISKRRCKQRRKTTKCVRALELPIQQALRGVEDQS